MRQCIKFILFWNDTVHVSDGLTFHNQELKSVHTATVIRQTDTAVCLIGSSRLYTQQPNRYCCLLASKQTAVSVWQMLVFVCTVL